MQKKGGGERKNNKKREERGEERGKRERKEGRLKFDVYGTNYFLVALGIDSWLNCHRQCTAVMMHITIHHPPVQLLRGLEPGHCIHQPLQHSFHVVCRIYSAKVHVFVLTYPYLAC